MICPNCTEDNAPSARFCRTCGQQYGESCLICGFENPAESSYCGGCGARLLEVGLEGRDGERRQLTVLFCDLVGSTELSQTMDPEDYGDLLAAYHRICGQAVYLHDGFVAQYLGDGVVIYFGYPRAHEDDAQRAVRCGIDIIDGIRSLAKEGVSHRRASSSARRPHRAGGGGAGRSRRSSKSYRGGRDAEHCRSRAG